MIAFFNITSINYYVFKLLSLTPKITMYATKFNERNITITPINTIKNAFIGPCTIGINASIPVTTDKYTYTITSVLTGLDNVCSCFFSRFLEANP